MSTARAVGRLTPDVASKKAAHPSKANHSSNPSPRSHTAQTTHSMVNPQGRMDSSGRPGLGCFWLAQRLRVRTIRNVYRARFATNRAEIMRVRYGWVRFTPPNCPLGIVGVPTLNGALNWETRDRRQNRLGYAYLPESPVAQVGLEI